MSKLKARRCMVSPGCLHTTPLRRPPGEISGLRKRAAMLLAHLFGLVVLAYAQPLLVKLQLFLIDVAVRLHRIGVHAGALGTRLLAAGFVAGRSVFLRWGSCLVGACHVRLLGCWVHASRARFIPLRAPRSRNPEPVPAGW